MMDLRRLKGIGMANDNVGNQTIPLNQVVRLASGVSCGTGEIA
jgi:hypothetical protein